MNALIGEAFRLLTGQGFEYAICGGFALELFLNTTIRKHGDIDICAYWKDRSTIVTWMQSQGWKVYEMCGGGVVHHLTGSAVPGEDKRNILCTKGECELVSFTPRGEENMYDHTFTLCGQSSFNFVEFLFNDRAGDEFIYARNPEIRRDLSHAILARDGIPYVAPEIVLLYKSAHIQREGYQLDFDTTAPRLSTGQKTWLNHALARQYPQGHAWLE